MMCSVLFAAGCFTGIMKGTGMITEMATALTSIIPSALGRFFPIIVGVIAMPASLLFDPDSFYYGVLPVLAQTAEGFGVAGVNVGQAAILGQMTTGFPISPLTASTFLLVGLAGVDLGEHRRRALARPHTRAYAPPRSMTPLPSPLLCLLHCLPTTINPSQPCA